MSASRKERVPETSGLKPTRLAVIGAGFVGLTTAACFASRGYHAYAYDNDEERVKAINAGKPPFYEPGLEPLLKQGLAKKLLRVTSNPTEALAESSFVFICVNTPSLPNGEIDLSQVRLATSAVSVNLGRMTLKPTVIVKSTVVPGTTQNLVKTTLESPPKHEAGRDFHLCMNPEFLREGSAVYDTFHANRVIIGEYDKASGQSLERLMQGFYGKNCPLILRMSLASAEMVKYANNAFLATKISFMNEIANLCEQIPNVDVVQVAEAIGFDPRIGSSFLNAGLGFGGACFPKDVRAFIKFSRNLGGELTILTTVLAVNNQRPMHVVNIVEKTLGDVNSKTISLLGLAFKPDTSDLREAVALRLIDLLSARGARIKVYDPQAMPQAKLLLDKKVAFTNSPKQCIQDADCVIVATEWNEFRKLTPQDFKESVHKPCFLIDGRRIFNPEKYEDKLTFYAVGRRPSFNPQQTAKP